MSEENLRRDKLETHLSELMRAATGDPGAFAQLASMPPGIEGWIDIVSIGWRESPCASVSNRLDLAGAEAAVLHEAGHWLEGHEVLGSAAWRKYQEARKRDMADGTRTRGRLERAADRRALEELEGASVRAVLGVPAEQVADLLLADALQYGDLEP